MALSAFTGEEVNYSNQNLTNEDLAARSRRLEDSRNKFKLFVGDWTRGNIFPYRSMILEHPRPHAPLIELDLEELQAFDEQLLREVLESPAELLHEFEKGAQEYYSHFFPGSRALPFQVSLVSSQKTHILRELDSELIGKLVILPVIVVAASKPSIKATSICAQCKNCAGLHTVEIAPGLSGMALPRVCLAPRPPEGSRRTKCPLDPYVILPERCEFIDQQTMKLQERPEDIPTGDMPRTVTGTLDRFLVDCVTPGSRVTILAVFSVSGKVQSSLRSSYLRVIGVMVDDSEKSRFRHFYTLDDEEAFHKLSREPELYTKIAHSIAPAIFGNSDIKKAIACLLFSGTRKILPEGIRLRGDINVLLLGDPSTAKSQLLKFVGRVAPIAVITSGKGSSAAGLTASVIKDHASQEYHLEGGAMVLADGGVVCIDEFDKMRPEDRVAIHEAMEQQTISVAKAGITTILNSRTSVLAAANPIYGSYDDLKQAKDQIDLQTTVLSRFDCIFLVRDVRDEAHDKKLAEHLISLHMGNMMPLEESAEIETSLLKKYIAYAKAKCSPRLSPGSASILENFYVQDRKNTTENSAFPITVRQLEAIIRLAESMAKMRLSSEVSSEDIEEAHRLFEQSTLNAAQSGLGISGISIPLELAETVQRVEEAVKRKIGIGTAIARSRLENELSALFPNARAIAMGILNMISRGDLQEQSQRRKLKRVS